MSTFTLPLVEPPESLTDLINEMLVEMGEDPMLCPHYLLSRDGLEVMRGGEFECLGHFHKSASYSLDWGCKYEGWSLVLVEPS